MFVYDQHKTEHHSQHTRWLLGPILQKDFSIVIQIPWKFDSALIEVVAKWSLSNFAHDTKAVLLCHVQNFVVV